MAGKKVLCGHEASMAIKDGINKLAKAVKVTMGPRGRNVIIEKSFGSPTITKEGVTVANELELADAYENIGAQLVKASQSSQSCRIRRRYREALDGEMVAQIFSRPA